VRAPSPIGMITGMEGTTNGTHLLRARSNNRRRARSSSSPTRGRSVTPANQWRISLYCRYGWSVRLVAVRPRSATRQPTSAGAVQRPVPCSWSLAQGDSELPSLEWHVQAWEQAGLHEVGWWVMSVGGGLVMWATKPVES
jgi:hypothetical protein